MEPEFWTVFSAAKAEEAAAAAGGPGRVQDVLLRIHAPGDTFYTGHQGGFEAATWSAPPTTWTSWTVPGSPGSPRSPRCCSPRRTDRVGRPTTSHPAGAAAALAATGRSAQVNAPGTTSSAMFGTLAEAGRHPGRAGPRADRHHAAARRARRAAGGARRLLRHRGVPQYGGRAYCFGGGLYIDPVFADYQVQALVVPGGDFDGAFLADAEIPPPSMIDYYGMLTPPDGRRSGPGTPSSSDSASRRSSPVRSSSRSAGSTAQARGPGRVGGRRTCQPAADRPAEPRYSIARQRKGDPHEPEHSTPLRPATRRRPGRLTGGAIGASRRRGPRHGLHGPGDQRRLQHPARGRQDRLRAALRHPAGHAGLPDHGVHDRRLLQQAAVGRLRLHLQHARLRQGHWLHLRLDPRAGLRRRRADAVLGDGRLRQPVPGQPVQPEHPVVGHQRGRSWRSSGSSARAASAARPRPR